MRYLRGRAKPVDSVKLARELLATRIAEEATARRVLESAFAGDPRLVYEEGGWQETGAPLPAAKPGRPAAAQDPDRVLIVLKGNRPSRREPFVLREMAAVRFQGGDVVEACGGDTSPGAEGRQLRRVVLEILEGAVPVLHDPPGSLRALEQWLDEPLDAPISLRRLGRVRKGLPAAHDLETLAGKLGLEWRDSDDPVVLAGALDTCLRTLRRPGESLQELRTSSAGDAQPIDWSRFAFNKKFLRTIPQVPGTYKFYDHEGRLIYAGKSRNLNRRIGSYFRQGPGRSARVQRLLDNLHRIEIEPVASDLEAIMREAELIREERPERNVQRHIHPRMTHFARLKSILILEPASSPLVLRAYLLRDGRLVGKVGIGPRGGGLRRIERLLEDHFFCLPTGPTPVTGPDVDVEMVARWLAANRDRVLAFDPTDLPGAREVTDRLRWFLSQGAPIDPDGTPILNR